MKNKQQNTEQLFEQHLEGTVIHEQPRPEWKVELIETMEKQIEKKRKRGGVWKIVFAGALPMAIIVGFMLYNGGETVPGVVEDPDGVYSLGPFHIPSEWDKEYVSYEYDDSLKLPLYFADPIITYSTFSEETLAQLLEMFDMDIAEYELTYTDDNTIRGEDSAGRYIYFEKGWNDGTLTFQIEIADIDYDEEENFKNLDTQRDAAKQIADSFIEAHPAMISGQSYELYGMAPSEVEVWVNHGNDVWVEAYTLGIHQGEVKRINGFVYNDAVQGKKGDEYPSPAEAIDSFNYAPAFPVHTGDNPEIGIVYKITDIRYTNRGPEFYMELQNYAEVKKAFGMGMGIETRKKWVTVPTIEHIQAERDYLDSVGYIGNE